jgi:hypothetical protein
MKHLARASAVAGFAVALGLFAAPSAFAAEQPAAPEMRPDAQTAPAQQAPEQPQMGQEPQAQQQPQQGQEAQAQPGSKAERPHITNYYVALPFSRVIAEQGPGDTAATELQNHGGLAGVDNQSESIKTGDLRPQGHTPIAEVEGAEQDQGEGA